MRDVAERAGVSLKTVSRVVNAEAGVSDGLADRVRGAVQALDYRHNLAARNLRLSRQGACSFAVLVQDLSNSYSAALLRAIDDVARQHQIVMIAASLDEEAERERDLVADLIRRRVDGLILMPASHDQSYLWADVRAGFKVVIIDRAPGGLETDSVLVDNVAGAELATAHLLSHGHRRIGILTDDQRILTAQERLRGYRRALAAAGVDFDPEVVRSARTAADSVRQTGELLSLAEPPTAIFTARNDVTQGAVTALRKRGVSAEVALVGFDDFPLADELVPAVTVIGQEAGAVGRRATALLLDRLHGSTVAPQHVVLPTRLIVRGSGEIRPQAWPRQDLTIARTRVQGADAQPVGSASAAGDRGDDGDLGPVGDGRLEPTDEADILVADVDVDEAAQRTRVVQDPGPDARVVGLQGAEDLGQGRAVGADL